MENFIFNKIGAVENALVPPLGRFAFLHTANFAILAYLFILSYTNLEDQIRTISLTLVIILWLMLPALEVDEYDFLLREDEKAQSLSVHVLWTFLTIGLLYITIPLGLRTSIGLTYTYLGGSITIHPTYGTFPFITGVIAVWWYLRRLYTEMDNIRPVMKESHAS